MRHVSLMVMCTAGVLSTGSLALAQDPPQGPAKILQILREEVKPGRSTAHERLEAGYAKAFKAARRSPYLAMSTITGPSEAWFLVRFDSYAALEAENDAIEKDATLTQALGQLDEADAAFRTGQRAIIAEYREDLSYRPLSNIGGIHYVDVIIFRVRPGQVPTFEEARAISKKAHEQANVDERWAVYEVGSGMPAGTFLMLFGHKSLAELDTDPHTPAYREALGAEGRAKVQKLTGDAVQSVETMTFKFSPKMSYPPEWLVKADPDFWSPKTPAMSKSVAPAKPPAQ